MKFLTYLTILCMPFYVAALPHSSRCSPPEENKHEFIAPTEGDSRSPCPWINALSNHDYLPRNGRDIAIPQILEAVQEVYNVDPAVVVLFAKLGVLASPNASTFSLGDYVLHGYELASLHFLVDFLDSPFSAVEHDASISRGDFNSGDNTNFNESLYATMLAANQGLDYYDTTSASWVMEQKVKFSTENNPKYVGGGKEIAFRSTEAALYLTVMGDPSTAKAPKKVVDAIFREGRLPFAEGWKKPDVSITNDLLKPFIGTIQTGSNFVANNASYEGQFPVVLPG